MEVYLQAWASEAEGRGATALPGEKYTSYEPNEAAYIISCILSRQNIRPSQVHDRIQADIDLQIGLQVAQGHVPLPA